MTEETIPLQDESSATLRFQEKTTAHIRRLASTSEAMHRMYFFDPEHEDIPADLDRDIFFEKQLAPAKGLVCKYPGRALLLLSYTCAAHCRYCERQDRVGVGLDAEGRLTEAEIRAAVEAVRERPDISEVIFSGGDPLTHPTGLKLASELFGALPQVRILRIHTRFPLQFPEKVDFQALERIVEIPDVYYLSLHIDHPDELTPETEDVIRRLRKLGFILISQSVFLRGVNDDVDVLARMFERLTELGVHPYYIYHCQPIPTTARFVMEIADEVAIMTALRERITGLAYPHHIIELQHTSGKVVVPTNHWNFDMDVVRDFLGNAHPLRERTMAVQGPPAPEDFERGVLDEMKLRAGQLR